MADHNTLVGGSGGEIESGSARLGGVAYEIESGMTLAGGVEREIAFSRLPPIGTALNDCSWEEIAAVSDAGMASNYWEVGDTKTITINGTVGVTTFSNLSVDVFIIGFDHNSAKEGANRIHFQFCKLNGTNVALIDSKYSGGVDESGYFNMNPDNTNNGGWNSSYMRKTLLGNSGTPSSPGSNSLLAALPSDLRTVIKSVTKYSDNVGGGSSSSSNVTATTDYLWLLSEFEVQGAIQYANTAEKNYQAQYDYYKAGNSKLKYRHSSTSQTAYWWLRSVNKSYSNYYCRVDVNNNGGASARYPKNSYGVAPGFAV